MRHPLPVPGSLPPLWPAREPAVALPASDPFRGSDLGRRQWRRWWDRLGDDDLPDISCLQVRSVTAGADCRVTVTGEIDCMTAPGLQDVLRDILDRLPPGGRVEVDLGRITFLGAAGLTVLVAAHHLAEERGGVLCTRCGGARAVIRPLKITGLWAALSIVDRPADGTC